ncbi:MAG: DNA recombination protein RmuC [Bacteroidetes bacterium]|nr:DNA recombination protein RmuC [Bacteroidota bacterium]
MHGINTLDFVLLFIPVEPAFALAIEQDHELFNEAFEKNIVLVTTSTLLATRCELLQVSGDWNTKIRTQWKLLDNQVTFV